MKSSCEYKRTIKFEEQMLWDLEKTSEEQREKRKAQEDEVWFEFEDCVSPGILQKGKLDNLKEKI